MRGGCRACDCDPVGAESGACSEAGRCRCRYGVVGRRCDTCSSRSAELTVTDGNGDSSVVKCVVVYDRCPAELRWPRTAFGVERRRACPTGSVGVATRLCTSDALWRPVDYTRCIGDAFKDLARQLELIDKSALKVVTADIFFYIYIYISKYINDKV